MSEGLEQLVAPSADSYTLAFRTLGTLAESHFSMLRFHYSAPARTVTATQMAHAASFRHYGVANLQYGRLGRRIGKVLNFYPTTMPVDVLVTQSKPGSEWLWTMRPQVARALEQMGWVENVTLSRTDEVPPRVRLVEGSVCRFSVSAYDRNRIARAKCVEHYGPTCVVCGFNFGDIYGPLAEGFIHVHHIRPLSDIGVEYEVDPITDLRPVCPNCHAVIHLGGYTRSIEEVQQLMIGQARPPLKELSFRGSRDRL
jgi:putative restriction endonuclease